MFNQRAFVGPDDQQWSHLCDVGTWSHWEAIVTPFWAGGHRHMAVSIDDSGKVSETPVIGKHGTTVTHGDSRKHNTVDRGQDLGRKQGTTERIKIRGSNQYPTIVGLINNQPFNYLGVINSTLTLNQSMREGTVLHVQHIHKGIQAVCQQTQRWRLHSLSARPAVHLQWTSCRL